MVGWSLRSLHSLGVSLASALVVTAVSARARANDDLFPAQGDAVSHVGWSGGFFTIEGKRVFLRSGEIHYARVPRELWRDRLVRAKRQGLNVVQTYVFWNMHEPSEGTFDFSANVDLDAWLSLIQELGMYAVVRVGPYNCAEWDAGGLPAWLTVKPGMSIRDSSQPWLGYVDKLYEHVIPIVAKHQIHKGGNVLMVQLENEHPAGWGTDGNDYLTHLRTKAMALGLEVPLFYSGLHHGNDPAGDTPAPASEMPRYTTEFWSGSVDDYDTTKAPDASIADRVVRGTWKAVAFGWAGYDHYVIHGGTNFGYTSDDYVRTSYDYHSPIGEAGQLRGDYFGGIRHANTFGAAFNDLLTNAQATTAQYKATAGLRILQRSGSGGDVVFLDNGGTTAIDTTLTSATTTIPSAGKLTVAPGEIRPVPMNVPWTAGASFGYIATNVLGDVTLGDTTYRVCYGRTDETGEIAVDYHPAGGKAERVLYTFQYPDHTVTAVPVDSRDGSKMTLLVMGTTLADRTWITPDALVVGADYVNGDMRVELPSKGGSATAYTAKGQVTLTAPALDAIAPKTLGPWTTRDATPEAATGFVDDAWTKTAEPMSFAATDGFVNGYGWYRSKIHVTAAATKKIVFGGIADRAGVFLNGHLLAPVADAKSNEISLPLAAGDNTLAILVSEAGRPKIFGVTGPVAGIHYKGVWGPAAVENGSTSIASLRMSVNDAGPNQASTYAAAGYDDSTWAATPAGNDVMKSHVGYAWFRAGVDRATVPARALLRVNADDNAWVYVNGHLIGNHEGWASAATFDITASMVAGHNVIAICVQNVDGAGGIAEAPLLIDADPSIPLSFRFHGGLHDLDETPLRADVRNWQEFTSNGWGDSAAANAPRFFKATFANPTPANAFATFGVRTKGLGTGSVWVNGHNLGHYKGGDFLYVPEVWLTDTNTIVVYDDNGIVPKDITLESIELRSVNTDLVPPPPPPDAGAPPSEGGAPQNANDAGSGAANPDAPIDTPQEGCGCRAAPTSAAPSFGALFALLFARRWRRRSRATR